MRNHHLLIRYFQFCLLLTLLHCSALFANTELLILGTAQDAGYPQINCYKPHCMPGWKDKNKRRPATSIALIDSQTKQKWLFEASPNLPEQLYQLHRVAPDNEFNFSGIFLTHAHMGHYTGLMFLGREAAGTSGVPVFAMKKLRQFLKLNGPWSQLIKLNNIQLQPIANQQAVKLTQSISVTPFTVPHRDEFSETVGYQIDGPNKSAIFIPDIDKWQKWKTDIRQLIHKVDYAFLDATFYDQKELPNRDMSEIPHPFVVESMALFKNLSEDNKAKVHFIHINHSNPILDPYSPQTKTVLAKGFNIARTGLAVEL